MADKEQPKRNIDERLDAITMNLELLYRDRLADHERWQKEAQDFRDSLNVLRDATERLVIVAQAHDNRITKLERAS